MNRDVAATMDAIETLHRLVAEFCAGDPALAAHENVLGLILEELVTNTITHGGAAPDSSISVKLVRRGESIELLYEDSGCAFNPNAQLPEDDRDRSVEERGIGGLGWHLIREMCQSVDYTHREGRNCLRLIRQIG